MDRQAVRRAVYDRAVIDRWTRPLEETAWLDTAQGVCLLAAVSGFACATWLRDRAAFVAFLAGAGCLIVLVVLSGAEYVRSRCPHCSEFPHRSRRSAPRSVDCCPHCLRWLRSPYASDQAPSG